jgi:hypothetical protein
MPRYLFRVQYTLTDGSVTYEPVCVVAATEADARTEVDDATERYRIAVSATKVITLTSTT